MFTDKEQALFNHFEDENYTHIALRVMMALTYSCSLLGVWHPRSIVQNSEDNKVVCGWMHGARPACKKAAQMLYITSMSALMAQFDTDMPWVDTKTNIFADRGSREVGGGELQKLCAEWSEAHNRLPTCEVPIPSCLRELGWAGAGDLSHDCTDAGVVMSQLFDYWRKNGTDLGHDEEVFDELEKLFLDHVSGALPPAVKAFTEDCKDRFGLSAERTDLEA